MLQMNQHYEPEFKKKIVRLHLEGGRSIKGLNTEYQKQVYPTGQNNFVKNAR